MVSREIGAQSADWEIVVRTVWLRDIPEEHQPILDFWTSLKTGAALPCRGDLDVLDLQPWIGDLHLVEICGDDAKYIVYGTNVARSLGREWTGKRVSEIEPGNTGNLLSYFLDVRDEGRPLAHIVPAKFDGLPNTWTRIFLPFGDQTGRVRYVLVRNILLPKYMKTGTQRNPRLAINQGRL